MSWREKYQQLKELLHSYRSLTLGFSGGVDSTLLAAVAAEVLQDRFQAVIVQSAFYPQVERETALRFLEERRIAYQLVELEVLGIEALLHNPRNRCYLCKQAVFTRIKECGAWYGSSYIADGSNADDALCYRPGKKALQELGVVSPLAEVGLTKQEIRELSQELGLPTWNKPSLSCLATRFPYGELLTEQKLKQVEAAEQALQKYGFEQLRVRTHGLMARLEIAEADFTKLLQPQVRAEVVETLQGLGYQFVTLDLEKFTSGKFDKNAIIK